MVKYLDKFPFAFHVIALEPIKVQTRSAPLNDCMNLGFVKDTYGNGKIMARKGGKIVIYELQNFHEFFLTKSVKTGNGNFRVLCHSYRTN